MNPLFTLEYAVLLLALLVAAAIALAWRASARARGSKRVLLAALRGIGVFLLGLIALNPGRWHEERFGRDTEWSVLVDRSSSMRTPDAGGMPRWSEAVRLARKAGSVAGEGVKIRVYPFADRLENPAAPDLTGAAPSGRNTDIYQACKDVLGRYRTGDKKLAGIIMLSDGRHIGPRLSNVAIECRGQEAPVYALPLGAPVPKKDLVVSAPRKLLVSFVGQKLKIPGIVSAEGLGNIATDVILSGPDGREVARQKVELQAGGSAQVQFDVAATNKGFYQYTISAPKWADERNEGNNMVTIGLAVLQDKVKVFVAEGIPGWDSKFFIQLLRKQANMEVTSVYRVSSDRFFRVETDTSRTFESVQSIFPDSAAELGAYDVVVFGKGTEYFINPERMKLLRDFVREQGGCVVFARGKPYGATLPELELLEPVAWGEPLGTNYRLEPTRFGEYAGLFGDLLPGMSDPVWKRLPALTVAHRCAGVKAFSQVLVDGVYDVGGKQATFPAIISRRHGKGMVLTVNSEGMWQWDFFPSVKEAGQIYRDVWSQLLQWLVTYSEFLPGQEYAVRSSDSAVYPGTPVNVRISKRGLDAAAAPLVRLYGTNGIVQEVAAVKVSDAQNRWNVVFSLSSPGTYRVELAHLPGTAGGPCAVFQVNSQPTEDDELSADKGFLEELATASGGRLVQEDELVKLLARPPKVETADESKHVTWIPFWDRGWYLGLLLLCFSVEWFVRRRNGLM
ncbi:MAG: hypothetical protein C0404_12310 [Verrucomicrobia bacterium]|nr:hypothetical protein [Verrucomicrobiota bacterium]